MSTSFGDDAPAADLGSAPEAPSTTALRLPGPGLPEALLWVLLLLLAQAGFFLLLQGIVQIWTGGSNEVLEQKLGIDGILLLTFLPAALALLLLLPAGLWRLRPRPLRKLNLAWPTVTQLVVLLATAWALAYFCSSMQALLQQALFRWAEEGLPPESELRDLLDHSQLERVLLELRGASLWLLLLLIAVIPALGEEFIFRGVLGRGLIARWGVTGGIVLTSCLFAVAHIHPLQVIPLLPLAVYLHVAYLATRSFWAPVFVHFANNALAVCVLKFSRSSTWFASADGPSLLEWLGVGLSASIALAGTWAIWQLRSSYQTVAGETALPLFPTAEAPPPERQLRRITSRHPKILLCFALILLFEVVWFSLGYWLAE